MGLLLEHLRIQAQKLESSAKDRGAFISQICRAYNSGGKARTNVMLTSMGRDGDGAATPMTEHGIIAIRNFKSRR